VSEVERPKVGQTWLHEASGYWYRCTRAWPAIVFQGYGRTRRPSERALASGAWRRVL